jgi:hypothetical protein
MVPLGAFAMTTTIVITSLFWKMRDRELIAQQDLRLREMEHERKLKEMEIERLKLQAECLRFERAS